MSHQGLKNGAIYMVIHVIREDETMCLYINRQKEKVMQKKKKHSLLCDPEGATLRRCFMSLDTSLDSIGG